MPDSLLTLAPLLVLAVVLVLGFAGCGLPTSGAPVEDGVEDGVQPETPTLTLTLRASVPTALTVQSPGVKFAWLRAGATTEEQADVTAFWDDGEGNNVFDHAIPPAVDAAEPEPGGWLARCEMAVQADGQVADSTSGNFSFELPETGDYVVLFGTEGSPLAPPFQVAVVGVVQD
jgi:hypothetical protein